MQCIAIAAPMHIIGAAIADLHHGKRAARRRRSYFLRARHQRHHKCFVVLTEGKVVPVRRYFINGRQLAAGMIALSFTVQIDTDEQAFIGTGFGIENPVVAGGEMRRGSTFGNANSIAACRGYAVNARLIRTCGRGEAAAFLLFKHDRLAVW